MAIHDSSLVGQPHTIVVVPFLVPYKDSSLSSVVKFSATPFSSHMDVGKTPEDAKMIVSRRLSVPELVGSEEVARGNGCSVFKINSGRDGLGPELVRKASVFKQSSSLFGCGTITYLRNWILLWCVGCGQMHTYTMISHKVFEEGRGVFSTVVVDNGFHFQRGLIFY